MSEPTETAQERTHHLVSIIDQKLEAVRSRLEQVIEHVHLHDLSFKDVDKKLEAHLHSIQINVRELKHEIDKMIHACQMDIREMENRFDRIAHAQQQQLTRLANDHADMLNSLSRRLENIEKIIL